MQFPYPDSRQRIPAPASLQSKRPSNFHEMHEEPDNKEKIQKLRRLDSPTSPQNEAVRQFPSPSYVSIDVSNKTSPKVDPRYKRSVSPKALFPPSIQKFLSGRCSAGDAINKLKPPSSNKAHRDSIEKMRLLGALQTHDIEGNVISRKTSSTSPIFSPYYSISPQCFSPKTDVSPRGVNGSVMNEENTAMRIEDKMVTSPVGETLEPILEQAKPVNPNLESWKNNVMGYRSISSTTNGSMYSQATTQEARSYSYPNVIGNGSRQVPPEQKSQFASYLNISNQGQMASQTLPVEGTTSTNEEYEPRERTNSFLRDAGMPFSLKQFQMMSRHNTGNGSNMMPDCKSMVENQLNAIKTLVQHKRTISPIDHRRTISPVDHNRTLMQYFQKRNSNPENLIRDPTPQYFGTDYQQYQYFYQHGITPQGFNQVHNDKAEQSGFIYNQMEPKQNLENFIPYQSNMTILTENTSMEQCGSESNQELPNFTYIDPYSGAGSLGTGLELLEPDAFFCTDNYDSTEFDMNIIQSELHFVPKNESPIGYDDPLNPDPTAVDTYQNNLVPKLA